MRVKEIRVILRKAADLLEANPYRYSGFACFAIAKASKYGGISSNTPAAKYLKAAVAASSPYYAWLDGIAIEDKPSLMRAVASGHKARIEYWRDRVTVATAARRA